MKKQPISLKRSAFVHLLVITLAVVLIFYAIGLYLNFMGINNVRSDLQSAMDAEAQYLAGELQRELENLVVFQQELASESNLLRYVYAHSILSDYQRVENIRYVSNQLLRMKRFSSVVETARVHLPELNKSISADQTIYHDLDTDMWARFTQNSDMHPLQTVEWNGQIYLLLTRYEQKTPLFIIEVGLSPERLMKRLSVVSSDAEVAMLLLHEDGRFHAGTAGAVALNERLVPYGGEHRVGKAVYYVAEAAIPALNMRLRCINPMDEVMEPLLHHNQWVWALTLLAGALLAVYLLYYRIRILYPLNTIFESVRRAEQTGHFSIEGQNTDFDDIYAQFTAMVAKIDTLAKRVYEEQFRAQQAELRQLQMQINPHFFYNTLFMVYRMARSDGNEEIAQVCLNLSNYYRYITKMPEHDVPLKEEIDHIQQYLEIQKIRFSPRLTVETDELPKELWQEEIPPLMLQPIVENAFVHGMKGVTHDGHVEIRYAWDDERFSVTVCDNSGYMDDAAVQELNRQLECGEMEEGSALQNLNRRMALRYGKTYAMKLESYHKGLRVTVTFPRKERKTSAVAADR